ncbi:MAG TPA: DnrO protein [Tahibacter sp.]|nr:DnrO protein [Tahibacter sp.]
MNDRARLLAALLLSAFAATVAAAEPQADAHAAHHAHAEHTAASTTTPAQAPAQRWASDAALRDGMGRVRAALDELHHYELGHLPPAAAQDQAAQIEAAIDYLFAHCRLAPEPDAALHRILLPLLTSAQRLNRDPTQRDAIVAMRDAVAAYPRQFDDPGWPAATAKEP